MKPEHYEEIAGWFADMQRYILEHGWVQGKFEDRKTGAVCFIGASQKVLPKTTRNRLRVRETNRFYEFLFGEQHFFNPAQFNDRPDTTQQDVLDKMHEFELAAKERARDVPS